MVWHLLRAPDALALKTACKKLTPRDRGAFTSGRSILVLRRGHTGWGGLQSRARDWKVARRRARYGLASTPRPRRACIEDGM